MAAKGETLGKRVQRYLYGDRDKEDFSQKNLPATRKHLFFTLIRTRFLKLWTVNFLAAAFCIPLLAWHVLCESYISSFSAEGAEYLARYLQFAVFYRLPVRLVCVVPAFLGLSGVFYFIRQLCWGMPVSVTHTFFKGIRTHWKPFLALSFVYTLFSALFKMAFACLRVVGFGSFAIDMAVCALLIFAGVVCTSVLMFLTTLCTTYSMGFRRLVGTSVGLTAKYFFKTLGILLLSVLPFGLWFFIGFIYFDLIGCLLVVLVGIVYVVLLWVLYTMGIYDELINKNQYPDYYRKGLYVSQSKAADGGKESKDG